jgi:hypothetical protein
MALDDSGVAAASGFRLLPDGAISPFQRMKYEYGWEKEFFL